MRRTATITYILSLFFVLGSVNTTAQQAFSNDEKDSRKPWVDNVVEIFILADLVAHNENSGVNNVQTSGVDEASDVGDNNGTPVSGANTITGGDSDQQNVLTNTNTNYNQNDPDLVEWFHSANQNANTEVSRPVDENTSLKDLIKVYPNPASQVVFVDIPVAFKGNLVMYNLLGQPVVIQAVQGNELRQIAINDYPVGTYIIQLINSSNSTSIMIKISR